MALPGSCHSQRGGAETPMGPSHKRWCGRNLPKRGHEPRRKRPLEPGCINSHPSTNSWAIQTPSGYPNFRPIWRSKLECRRTIGHVSFPGRGQGKEHLHTLGQIKNLIVRWYMVQLVNENAIAVSAWLQNNAKERTYVYIYGSTARTWFNQWLRGPQCWCFIFGYWHIIPESIKEMNHEPEPTNNWWHISNQYEGKNPQNTPEAKQLVFWSVTPGPKKESITVSFQTSMFRGKLAVKLRGCRKKSCSLKNSTQWLSGEFCIVL